MKATAFLHEVDRAIASIGPFDHCCKPGCHHCCSEPTYATDAEVDDIVASLTPDQKDRVIPRLETWIQKVAGLLPLHMPNAFDWRRRNAVCPLLEDGLCMVYSQRPLGCRQFHATGNPDNCAMPMRIEQKFAYMHPRLFVRAFHALAADNPVIVMDNMGVLLAERLLGRRLHSGSRRVEDPTSHSQATSKSYEHHH